MATVLVTGATGQLGRHVVRQLLEEGHATRRLVHRSRPAQLGVEERPGDLRTGAGISEAVAGVDVVVHCATSPVRPRRVDVEGTGRLLHALEVAARPAHLIYISIVGIDEHPFFYYRAKSAAERLISESAVPWTILRATQFHEFIVRAFRPSDHLPFVIVPRGLRFQPMAASDAARRLVEIVGQGPSGRVPEVSGPEVRDIVDLARSYRRSRRKAARVVALPLVGRTAAAFRRGRHILGEPRYGRTTWDEFLADQQWR